MKYLRGARIYYSLQTNRVLHNWSRVSKYESWYKRLNSQGNIQLGLSIFNKVLKIRGLDLFLSTSVSYLSVYIDFKHDLVYVIAKNTSEYELIGEKH